VEKKRTGSAVGHQISSCLRACVGEGWADGWKLGGGDVIVVSNTGIAGSCGEYQSLAACSTLVKDGRAGRWDPTKSGNMPCCCPHHDAATNAAHLKGQPARISSIEAKTVYDTSAWICVDLRCEHASGAVSNYTDMFVQAWSTCQPSLYGPVFLLVYNSCPSFKACHPPRGSHHPGTQGYMCRLR
jgi:hypothetical protein